MIESTMHIIGDHVFQREHLADSDDHKARDDMLRLFSRVFGQAQSPLWHEWKYKQGQGQAVALRNTTGELVAHWGGLPRTLLWQGQPIRAMQNCDVMVAPEVRGLLTRRGPLFLVCSGFIATHVGENRPYALAFGFPNQRHMKLLNRLGLFHDAAPIRLLRWSAQSWAPGFLWRWMPLPESAPEILHAAWTAMASDLKDYMLATRDAGYLHWRFRERPDRDYRWFLLSGRLTNTSAVVILRHDGQTMELLDIIGPRNSFAAAIRAARREATRAGAHELTAWASPAAAQLLAGNATVEDSGASLAVATASTPVVTGIDVTRWWWMGGDTDFL